MSSTTGVTPPASEASRAPSASERTPARTSQPAVARRSAVARPIPREAPVTRTVGMARRYTVAPVPARRAIFVAPFDELYAPRLLAQLAARAEERGWDGFFLWDHIVYSAPADAVADPWVALAAVAAATERVAPGAPVTPPPPRPRPKPARGTVPPAHPSRG